MKKKSIGSSNLLLERLEVLQVIISMRQRIRCSIYIYQTILAFLLDDGIRFKMSKSTFKFCSKLALLLLCVLGFIELGLALWTVLDPRYRSLAYNLADVGYMVINRTSDCLAFLFSCNFRIYGY